ncbi:MAG: choice-of-anchor J domain-containing protein [Duncaniella sp.]|nr:choice-of-anchor J domain-containing protein [Duncaniella sp.]
MKKFLSQLLGGALAVSLALPVSAAGPARKMSGRGSEPQAVSSVSVKAVSGKHLAAPQGRRSRKSNPVTRFVTGTKPVNFVKKHAAPALEASGTSIQLRGNLYFSETWQDTGDVLGIYDIPVADGQEWNCVAPYVDALGGGVAINGVYYAVSYYESWLGRSASITTYDMETWDYIGEVDCDLTLLASDVTYDPVTGRVYGCFYDETLTSLSFGYVDYDTQTRTVIRQLDYDTYIAAIAADKNGNLFGVKDIGTVCSIDKETGAVTDIAETGLESVYPTSAVIDPRTGKMYYNHCGMDVCGLYEIDTTTGAAVRLADYPGLEQVLGMYVVLPPAEDNAPAAPTGLEAVFDGKSLSGKIVFSVPATFYGGAIGEGPVSYTVKCDGEMLAEGETAFGALVEAQVSVAAPGEHKFIVTLDNEAGPSPAATVVAFVGAGIPQAPSSVSLSYSDGSFTLSWLPVRSSADGGYVDAENVTYDVVRYPGEVVVARGISETTLTDPVAVPESLTRYYYEITARDGDLASDVARSPVYSLGAMELPFSENFDTSDSMELFTVLDGNDNGTCWEYNYLNKAARIMYSYEPMDDWMFTPPFNMEAGKMYRVEFAYYAYMENFVERLEVKWGASSTPEGMTETLLEPVDVSSTVESPSRFKGVIVPEADGNYVIGFHGISDPDCYYLYVDEISVSAAIAPGAPAAAENLSVQAAPDGSLSATVSFTAPSETIGGDRLTSISRIDVSRDGEVVKSFVSPAPGETLSFTDNTVPTSGRHTWSVVPFNADGAGDAVSATMFVGINRPGLIKKVTAAETANDGEVALSWIAPEADIDGNPISQSLVSYDLYEIGESGEVPVKKGLTETSYTYQAVAPDGEQNFHQWIVYPVTEAGRNDGRLSNIVAVGPALECPYSESFAGKKLGHNIVDSGVGNAEWSLYGDRDLDGVTSWDGDNGFAAMHSLTTGEYASLHFLKIRVPDGNPTLSFYLFCIADDDNSEIEVTAISEGKEVVLRSIVANVDGVPGGYKRVTVPLGEYSGKSLQISIKATIREYVYVIIDNIFVGELPGNDLAITGVAAPAEAKNGEEFNVMFRVENLGRLDAGNFDVALFRNGEKIAVKTLAGLAAGQGGVVAFPQRLSPVVGDGCEYHAEIVWNDDVNPDNNLSEKVVVKFRQTNLPAVDNIVGEQTGDMVRLSWDEPDVSLAKPQPVTEDFESGEPWAKKFGEWTLIDNDGGKVGGIKGVTIPGMEADVDLSQFFIFDTTDDSEFNRTFAAHSGNRYLASIYNVDASPVDEWAVSPILSGDAQTVSFYAASYSEYPESIEVRYSTTGSAIEDFTESVLDIPYLDQGWNLYEAELPAGAKYFAIRSYAADAFMLMIDDVTFTPELGELSLMGYNIYRDGVRINDAPVEEPAFTDADAADGEHLYHVTAVYDKGESMPVSVSVAKSGIPGVGASAVTVSVADRSIVITGAEGHPVAVYTVDGKTVYSSAGQARTVIPVQPGIYIVKAATTVRKVIVK